jgi:hypothetical protein
MARAPVGEVIGFDRVLLSEAARGVTRAKKGAAQEDADVVAGATAAAILCSAAACEARLSEYVTRQESLRTLPEHFVQTIRDEWDALEQWRLLLRQVAPTYKFGNNRVYLALGCLFELRNVVAHRHARAMVVGTRPRGIEPCIAQRTIPARKVETPMDWTSTVYVPEVAEWAFKTASDWLAIADQQGVTIAAPRPNPASGELG